jgi:hypothetical protein
MEADIRATTFPNREPPSDLTLHPRSPLRPRIKTRWKLAAHLRRFPLSGVSTRTARPGHGTSPFWGPLGFVSGTE